MPANKSSGSIDRFKARSTPYPSSKPTAVAAARDEENEAPRGSASPVNETLEAQKPKHGATDLPNHYLDIQLEEKKGEGPCYENVCPQHLLAESVN
jgi:hypothetical protein